MEVDLTGQRVGRYEIRSLLGRGGMGTVYRAHDSNLDRSVAIKILPPHLVTDADRVRRFVQEAKSASALNHPHVVSIHEIGEDSGLHYIAMELVEGSTLRDRLAGGTLDLKRSLAIGEQIAEAIGAAHEAGVVHRDLKPENVIIAASGYVKVLDFGLAKLHRESSGILGGDAATEVKSTEPGKILGTVGYMSPEQAQGKPVDHRSDIFSLGCMLYEMASGRAPFRGRSAVETLNNIAHVDPPPLGGPQELQRIVAKTLAKEPEDRYQSAKDLAVDLKRLMRELDSNATVSGAVGFSPRRSRIGLFAILALVVLAAIAAIVMATRRQRPVAEAPSSKAPLTIDRITSSGNVTAAAISPDGKYIAYVNSEQGQQSLVLRHLATGQDLQLVAPAEVGYWGQTFTPDGASIYYVIKSRQNPVGTLYSISILGGRSAKILDGLDSSVTFSPDGKKIAFVRGDFPNPSESALIVANADGTDVQVRAKRRPPDFFYPIFFTAPSWSPDGKTIALSMMTYDKGQRGRILAVDAASGAERVLSDGWEQSRHVAWLPDGSALIAIARRDGRIEGQLWRIPVAAGEPRPVTNDLLDYRLASISADGSTIVTVAQDMDSDLWFVPLNSREIPRKLVGGKAVGLAGLSVARDGSIAYTSLDGNNSDIWVTNLSAATPRQVTSGPEPDVNPMFTPDGKDILFTTYGAHTKIRRIAADGGGRASVVVETDWGTAALSPDGKTLVFGTMSGLSRIAPSGGPAAVLTNYPVERTAISPDGTRIAGYCRPRPDGPQQLCIIPISGGAPEKTYDVAGPHFMSMIRWTPDGRALLLTTMPTDRRNLWRFPLDGGEPRALTNFSDQTLFRFDLTPDGKAVIASRGELTRDVMMIKGFL